MIPEENDSAMIVILPEEEGERLDKILIQRYPSYSRTYFQRLIEDQLVLLDGNPIKKREKLKSGSEVEIFFAITPEIDLTPENIPLDIIYEDADILLINKKPGMVVHPAPGNWSGTFVNALLFHCKELGDSWNSEEALRPGIVHRLDKDTSGLLLAAKTTHAHRVLVEQFASRQVKKEYLAICLGNPGDGVINEPIGRHPIHRKMMAIVPDGKPAITIIKTLKTKGLLSLVRALPTTGRTHQIRVHLKHKGTPIIGDSLYGNSQMNARYQAKRQWLHAEKLSFNHPSSGKLMEFIAPLPSDMKL